MANKQNKPEPWGVPDADDYRAAAKEHSNIPQRHPDEPTPQPPMLPAQYEVRLNDGTRLYGYISFIDHEEEEFYLLDRTQAGMFGKKNDGQRISFSDCSGVFSMSSPGVYGSSDHIEQWRRFWKQNRL